MTCFVAISTTHMPSSVVVAGKHSKYIYEAFDQYKKKHKKKKKKKKKQ